MGGMVGSSLLQGLMASQGRGTGPGPGTPAGGQPAPDFGSAFLQAMRQQPQQSQNPLGSLLGLLMRGGLL
jgi:hypothetical protein